MLAPALAMLLCAADPGSSFLMKIDGTTVGSVRLSLAAKADGGSSFEYASDTYVRRGPARTHNGAHARLTLKPDHSIEGLDAQRREAGALIRDVHAVLEGRSLALRVVGPEGATTTRKVAVPIFPSALAYERFGPERSCFPVLEETTGAAGEACGARAGDEVRGTILGEPFVARLEGARLQRLELPGQRTVFERGAVEPLDPPDIFGAPVTAAGLAGRESEEALTLLVESPEPLSLPEAENQHVSQAGAGRVRVRWTRLSADKGPAWTKAGELARKVDESIPDKRPGAFERTPERVLAEGRGACVAHAEAFVFLAKKGGLGARRALGLVAAEGKLWPHEWAQIEIRGRWYDVDPSEGSAPARAARILFAAGEAVDERAAARLAALARQVKVTIER